MLIIAVTGLRCAGKSIVTDIAKEYNMPVYEGSDVVIKLLEQLYPNGGMDIRTFSTNLRKNNGKEAVAKLVYEKAIKENPNTDVFMFSGMRSKYELQYLKGLPNVRVITIAVIADDELRFKRLKQRNRPRDPKTLEEFKRVEAIENKWGLAEVISMVDYTIENNGSADEVKKKISKLLNVIIN